MNFLSAIKRLFQTSPTYSPVVVLYDDPAITYLGRWQDTGEGMWSGWAGGPQIVFKVSGVTQFHVVMDIENGDTADTAAITYNIDSSPISPAVYMYTAVGESYVGKKMGLITLPDTGEHTINIHTVGFNAAVFAGTSKMTLKEILLPPGGSITLWTQGPKIIQAVGDSWMGGQNDWPRLMDTALWTLVPVGAGGLKASDMDTQYNYKSDGVAATDDPAMDGIIVSFGVNDYNASVSVGAFQTSLLSVVDKIQTKQPGVEIFLIQVPDNVGDSKAYGQYGTAMSNITGLRSNVNYVSTESLEATITWTDDMGHLDDAGKVLLADFVNTALVDAGI